MSAFLALRSDVIRSAKRNPFEVLTFLKSFATVIVRCHQLAPILPSPCTSFYQSISLTSKGQTAAVVLIFVGILRLSHCFSCTARNCNSFHVRSTFPEPNRFYQMLYKICLEFILAYVNSSSQNNLENILPLVRIDRECSSRAVKFAVVWFRNAAHLELIRVTTILLLVRRFFFHLVEPHVSLQYMRVCKRLNVRFCSIFRVKNLLLLPFNSTENWGNISLQKMLP